jgi:4-hydroxy-2-oxoheptanedioate aldolase
MRINRLKQMWSQGQAATNLWSTIPSAWTAEVLSQTGYDAITIDMQHGLADYSTALAMLQAMSASPVTPIVRVPWNEPAMPMRMLDAGAYAIICPMVNNRHETENFVGACYYPPLGYRSFGPTRANVYSGEDYFQHANETVLSLAMIETAEAMVNLDAILSVPGLSGVYVGTVDLSISLGLKGLGDMNDPDLRRALETILAGCARYNLVAGVHAATAQEFEMLSKWGFRLITPATDTTLLVAAAKNTLELFKSYRTGK